MTPGVLVVADDLTGACDTGTRFAERGFETAVQVGPDETAADVVVRDTDSRSIAPADAADRVRAAITAVPAHIVYNKVDSTLRGNLVPEIDAAIEATGADLALVAPAFPQAGRTTSGGRHRVHGTPVAESDPGRNLATSDIPTLLAALDRPIEAVAESTVDNGVDAVEQVLAELQAAPEPTVAVCDATQPAHLATLARAAARLPTPPLYVGSAGLAGHVRVHPSRPVLGVAGSVAEETLAQLQALPADCLVSLDAGAAIESDDAVDDAVERSVDTLQQTGEVVLTAATNQRDVTATLEAGRSAGLDDADTRDRVADMLATATRRLADRCDLGGLFVTGGAVAADTVAELGGSGIELTGTDVAAGIPVGRLAGGDHDGLPIVTKAGAFGDESAIRASIERLGGYHG